MHPNTPTKDWAKEDEWLVKAVEGIEHVEEFSLSAISRLVNDRSYIRKQLHNLPKTRALLIRLGKAEQD